MASKYWRSPANVSSHDLLLPNLLILVSLVIFALGFFPYKAFLPGHASFTADEASLAQQAPFDKVVFMVVDALRSDFVFSHPSGFRFTQQLIRSGSALPYTAHAGAPTITMPRIKAMTTGSTPSFLDVILNFAEGDKSSSLESQDTWLGQLKAKRDGRLVFYGDDTWLKLFPTTFARAEGTSSFFVSDFTEVDFNVTRNVPGALDQNDWTGMILHYLGLDHIGHKSGPTSPHMIPKQAEMDDIIRRIYQGLESKNHLQSTLLVLCGDHGMNDAGNHGGSAEGETSPALVFISPKLRSISQGIECPTAPLSGDLGFYTKIDQSDVAPTLAGLLGIPIPKNNLGVFIPDLLRFWPQGESVRLLKQNAGQVLGVVKETFPTFSFEDGPQSEGQSEACADITLDGTRLACLWSGISNSGDSKGQEHDEQVQQAALHAFLTQAQLVMSKTAGNYSIWKLCAGTAIAALVTLWTFFHLFPVLVQKPTFGVWFSLVTLTYGATMFASSYVEEEHQYWYLVASTWLGWLGMKRVRRCLGVWAGGAAVTPLLIMRIIRGWNQTGQKNASQPDIARVILPVHNYVLWVLVFASYLTALVKISVPSQSRMLRALFVVVAFGLCMVALAFKISFTMADSPELLKGIVLVRAFALGGIDLVIQARAVFLGMVIYAVGITLSNRAMWRRPGFRKRVLKPIAVWLENDGGEQEGQAEALHGVLALFLMTQTRVTNIPLFILFEVQLQVLASMDLSTCELSLTSIILQYTSFFAFGGSNAISSVDLSNAYNGVSGYSVAAVALLTFCTNWAGPLWWVTATLLLMGRNRRDQCRGVRQLQLFSTCFIATTNMFVMLACTLLRTHLFIWTVFSPKFLFTLAWCLGQYFCISTTAFKLYIWLWSE